MSGPLPGNSTAVLFPGMASSTFGEVGRFMVLDRYVRPRLRAAEDALGESLLAGFKAEAAHYGPFSQVAFLVNSLALADRAEAELGLCPDVCVGPSFGQRAAAVFAGALDFGDAVRLTASLAACEEEYFAGEPDELVTQCFVRVPDEPLQALLADLDKRGEWNEISVELGHGTVMLSLCEAVLDEVVAAVRAMGGYAMQTMRPPVHARRFTPLREKASAVLAGYALADPRLPIVADQDGRVVRTADDLRTMLLDTFDRPVDWPAATATLSAMDVGTVYVTGPDQLFQKLRATKSLGRVIPVTPKTAARPT